MTTSDILGTLDVLESWGRNGQKILKQANMYVNWFFNLLRVRERWVPVVPKVSLCSKEKYVVLLF